MPGPAAWRRWRAEDDGFTILEVTISLVLILMVMVASTAFFVRAMGSSVLTEQRQSAGVLVDKTIEQARALAPAKLIDGRTTTNISNEKALRPTGASLGPNTLLPLLTSTLGLPIDTATPPLPLSSSTTTGGTTYLVRAFVDGCIRALAVSAGCSSNLDLSSVTNSLTALKGTLTTAPTARLMLRITVSVTWQSRSGSCTLAGGYCEALGTTLIDSGSDPTFPNGA